MSYQLCVRCFISVTSFYPRVVLGSCMFTYQVRWRALGCCASLALCSLSWSLEPSLSLSKDTFLNYMEIAFAWISLLQSPWPPKDDHLLSGLAIGHSSPSSTCLGSLTPLVLERVYGRQNPKMTLNDLHPYIISSSWMWLDSEHRIGYDSCDHFITWQKAFAYVINVN